MTNSLKSSAPQGARAIVLSIKPKYAELILAGSKTVEFRRVWAAKEVDTIAIYASAPVQGLVGVVSVSSVVRAKPRILWEYCSKRGGGLSRNQLYAYFDGKETGVAVLLENVQRFSRNIDPKKVIKGFSAPQSFRYLTPADVIKLQKAIQRSEGSQ